MATRPRFNPMEHVVDVTRTNNRHQENSARLAHSKGSFTTTGWGEFNPEDAITFSSPYLERPTVTYGWSLEEEDDAEELRVTRYPRANGGVLRWNRTAQGFYTGAYVVICVEDRSPFIASTDPDPDPTYNILHDFVFLGVAMKDITSPLNGDLREV